MAEISAKNKGAIIGVLLSLTVGLNSLQSEIRQLREILSSLLSKQDPSITEVQEWLTLEQLKEYIPGHPSTPTLRRWIKQENMPSQRIKRKLVFKKTDIDAWLNSRTGATDVELEKKAEQFLKSSGKSHVAPWRQK